MKTKQSFTHRLAAMLMLHAMLVLTVFAPFQMQALDVQTLPTDTRASSGFTHAARVTWDDLNASDNSLTTITLMTIPTNAYIDRVAFYIEEGFTNTVAAGTNLAITVGITGTTNRFFGSNCIDGASIQVANGFTVWGLSTNLLVPYKSTTDAIALLATFGSTGSTVDNYNVGKVRIYWRVVEPAKYKF
jgi:hypothetical protein